MGKEIFYDKNALKELYQFGAEIQNFFQKKTQKTPLKNIKLAQQRLKQYE